MSASSPQGEWVETHSTFAFTSRLTAEESYLSPNLANPSHPSSSSLTSSSLPMTSKNDLSSFSVSATAREASTEPSLVEVGRERRSAKTLELA